MRHGFGINGEVRGLFRLNYYGISMVSFHLNKKWSLNSK